MIYGLPMDRNIVQTLHESKFPFYLTGSRYFELNREDSDYDFYAKDSTEIRTFLRSQGFHSLPNGYNGHYEDYNIAVVYEYSNIVHIQLQTNIELKHKAQLVMKEMIHRWKGVDKSQMRWWWNDIYSALRVLDAGNMEF